MKFEIVVVVLTTVSVVHAEFCYFGYLDRRYCEYGCCRKYGSQYCCTPPDVGMIVGIVIGCIALVAIVVSVLVAVFCCCRKTRGRAGQVNQPMAPVNQVPAYQPNTVMYGPTYYPVTTNYQQVPYTTTQTWQAPPQTRQAPPPYEPPPPKTESRQTATQPVLSYNN